MKKHLVILTLILLFSFVSLAYGEEIVSFSKNELLFEEIDDVFYIDIVNNSSKETILYEVDDFPEFLIVDPLEGKIFPMGEERIKVKYRKSAEFKEQSGEITFIYAKKSSPRNLIYKRIKVFVKPYVPKATPTTTPLPTPTFTVTPTFTPIPTPTFTPVPTPTFTPLPTSTPTPVPTLTPTPVPTATPLAIEIRMLGVEGKRPVVYKEGLGFVPLKDEIAVGEPIKFEAIWDKNVVPESIGLSWSTDKDTEIVKMEGDFGELITLKKNSVGTGTLKCSIYGPDGNLLAEGETTFEVTISPQMLEETKKIKEEIKEKLKKAKALYDVRDLEGAKALYNEVLSIDPENKDAKYGLSRVDKAKRSQKKVISIYNKAKSYLNKGNIKAAYGQIMSIGNYMWAFPKDDPWREKVSSLKKRILSLYHEGGTGLSKIRKYKAPGTNIYIYTGGKDILEAFAKRLGPVFVKTEIPGFDDRYIFYGYEKGIIIRSLSTGKWEGVYRTNKTYSLDLAFLKVLSADKTLLSKLGKGRTPGIMLFKGLLKVQLFQNGVIIKETKSNTIWYTVY